MHPDRPTESHAVPTRRPPPPTPPPGPGSAQRLSRRAPFAAAALAVALTPGLAGADAGAERAESSDTVEPSPPRSRSWQARPYPYAAPSDPLADEADPLLRPRLHAGLTAGRGGDVRTRIWVAGQKVAQGSLPHADSLALGAYAALEVPLTRVLSVGVRAAFTRWGVEIEHDFEDRWHELVDLGATIHLNVLATEDLRCALVVLGGPSLDFAPSESVVGGDIDPVLAHHLGGLFHTALAFPGGAISFDAGFVAHRALADIDFDDGSDADVERLVGHTLLQGGVTVRL